MRLTCSAHKQAYELAGILHRDISVDNILIKPDGRGLLADWDLSKPVDATGKSASERTGTWQFMAAHLLLKPNERREEVLAPNLADDLESFVHVLTWLALRYTPLIQSSQNESGYEELGKTMAAVYDSSYQDANGNFRGGQYKADTLRTCSLLEYLPKSPLRDLLYRLYRVVAVRYEPDPGIEGHVGLSPEERRLLHDLHRKQLNNLLNYLKTSDWMIETFEDSLKDKNIWASFGAAKLNPIPGFVHRITRRRSSEMSGLGGQSEPTPSSSSKRPRLDEISEER